MNKTTDSVLGKKMIYKMTYDRCLAIAGKWRITSERECRKREREREVAVKKWGVIEMYGANWLKNRYLRLVYDW